MRKSKHYLENSFAQCRRFGKTILAIQAKKVPSTYRSPSIGLRRATAYPHETKGKAQKLITTRGVAPPCSHAA